MKKLILLAFMLTANVFAGEAQERFCDDKSLSYCIKHYDRQCNAKNYLACWLVGSLHSEQEQYSQVKKYYEMVCDKANSKDSFALELIDGRLINGDMTISVIENMQIACNDLGTFYYNGVGVRQSYEKALHYFKKACDLENGVSCARAGKMYYDGKGAKEDLKSAIAFFAKSCKLEYGGGCAILGAFYHDGLVVKQNYSKAKELYGKACDLGYQMGCDNYKKLKENGY